jgi:hypothetical protein
MFHVFQMVRPLPESRQAFREVVAFVTRAEAAARHRVPGTAAS